MFNSSNNCGRVRIFIGFIFLCEDGNVFVSLLFSKSSLLIVLILFDPLFIIGIIWLIIRFISYNNTDLILTNKRVFGKCGLISTTQMQCPLNKINSISYTSGLIGRLIGYGTVRISSGATHYKFRFIRDGQTLYSDIFHNFELAEKEKIFENAEAIADAIGRRID